MRPSRESKSQVSDNRAEMLEECDDVLDEARELKHEINHNLSVTMRIILSFIIKDHFILVIVTRNL